MALFAIGDLHLSFGCDKPMDKFYGWSNYIERLLVNWNALVNDDDTVVIVGDVSWGMTLHQAYEDFLFINDELKGKKIIIKGNHDYWWTTAAKMNSFLQQNQLDNIQILSNNSYQVDGVMICGSRGWINETQEEFDKKILAREAGRLEMSLKDALKHKKDEELLVFLHYPPIYAQEKNYYILEVLEKYNIKHCYYAHIHGVGAHKAFTGESGGITFHAVSADLIEFTPKYINIK
ncbi:MAG: metallophosphoesterase [Oscillospiraceae bacterium]|nr:metallophosphoesterase [Oscillospiraceae bacterium]